ncbi:hypothetical protein SteCoe_36343 [Stentor coeruleus]|uniref:Uncharacterized protein n=1 Tax=Stentor coeruleus TaxID=5963 RepID=A0A1R2AQG3_9CILI|nr:hypothetical protein SteCoe_36343 [Stentor coeruleus]
MSLPNKKLRSVDSLLYRLPKTERPICSLMNRFHILGKKENHMPKYSINWESYNTRHKKSISDFSYFPSLNQNSSVSKISFNRKDSIRLSVLKNSLCYFKATHNRHSLPRNIT